MGQAAALPPHTGCQPGLGHVRGDDVRGAERPRMSECHKWIYCETVTTLTEFTRTRPFVQLVWGKVSNRTGPDAAQWLHCRSK